eukprot:gene32183-54619_t
MEGFLAARLFTEGLRRAGSRTTRDGLISGLESIGTTSIGGYSVSLSPTNHVASRYAELSMLTGDGRVPTSWRFSLGPAHRPPQRSSLLAQRLRALPAAAIARPLDQHAFGGLGHDPAVGAVQAALVQTVDTNAHRETGRLEITLEKLQHRDSLGIANEASGGGPPSHRRGTSDFFKQLETP